jgi:hypothetical protein
MLLGFAPTQSGTLRRHGFSRRAIVARDKGIAGFVKTSDRAIARRALAVFQ